MANVKAWIGWTSTRSPAFLPARPAIILGSKSARGMMTVSILTLGTASSMSLTTASQSPWVRDIGWLFHQESLIGSLPVAGAATGAPPAGLSAGFPAAAGAGVGAAGAEHAATASTA